jgi:hypothetical protein
VSDGARKICIVLDTNVWLSDHVLRTRLGASLVHTVAQLGAIIGLPEVVERELKPRWLDRIRDLLGRAVPIARLLVSMAGEEDEDLYLPPSEEQLVHAQQERLAELEAIMERAPLTLAQTSRAMDRVIARLPPSAKEEQFRDSALWEAVLDLGTRYDVHFITGDGAFFTHPDPKSGTTLAANLADDREKAGAKVRCYRQLQECLEALKQDVKPLPERELEDAVAAAIRERLDRRVSTAEFVTAELVELSIKAFETGKPVFALAFSLTFALQTKRAGDDDRANPRLTVTGECVFDPKTKVVSGAEIESEELSWSDAEGKRHRARPSDADSPWVTVGALQAAGRQSGTQLIVPDFGQTPLPLRYVMTNLYAQLRWEEF